MSTMIDTIEKKSRKNRRKVWRSKDGTIELRNGDSLRDAGDISDVDAMISDPPYGIIDCEWDDAPSAEQLGRLATATCKPCAVICLFAAQPFTTELVHGLRKWFRYDLVWMKHRVTGFLNANRMPLKQHESILIFGRVKKDAFYCPQKSRGKPYRADNRKPCEIYRNHKRVPSVNLGDRHPTSVLRFDESQIGRIHPTQKPVALMEHLVRSYSREGELVFDPFAGSGSTAVACRRANRRFIGYEKDAKNFAAAVKRLKAECDIS
jgi:hypothetical protein